MDCPIIGQAAGYRVRRDRGASALGLQARVQAHRRSGELDLAEDASDQAQVRPDGTSVRKSSRTAAGDPGYLEEEAEITVAGWKNRKFDNISYPIASEEGYFHLIRLCYNYRDYLFLAIATAWERRHRIDFSHDDRDTRYCGSSQKIEIISIRDRNVHVLGLIRADRSAWTT